MFELRTEKKIIRQKYPDFSRLYLLVRSVLLTFLSFVLNTLDYGSLKILREWKKELMNENVCCPTTNKSDKTILNTCILYLVKMIDSLLEKPAPTFINIVSLHHFQISYQNFDPNVYLRSFRKTGKGLISNTLCSSLEFQIYFKCVPWPIQL